MNSKCIASTEEGEERRVPPMRAKIMASFLAECHLLDSRLRKDRGKRGFHGSPYLHMVVVLRWYARANEELRLPKSFSVNIKRIWYSICKLMQK